MRIRTLLVPLLALLSGCIVAPRRVYDEKLVAASSDAQFEQLKALEGTWKGMAEAHGESFPAEVRYHVTAGGSAVEETLFAGTEHEMVSLYHRDGPWLMMTHYCASGNQPRMRAVHVAPPPTGQNMWLEFGFLDATNVTGPDDHYMHAARFQRVGDSLELTWASWDHGKPGETVQIRLKRAGA